MGLGLRWRIQHFIDVPVENIKTLPYIVLHSSCYSFGIAFYAVPGH